MGIVAELYLTERLKVKASLTSPAVPFEAKNIIFPFKEACYEKTLFAVLPDFCANPLGNGISGK
jgi:hypothetical protein